MKLLRSMGRINYRGRVDCPEIEFKYPVYRKYKKDNLIVEFTGLQEGKVVQEGCTSPHPIGYISEGWTKHTDTDIWEECDYNG